jgi:anti-sigma B factor antagonist
MAADDQLQLTTDVVGDVGVLRVHGEVDHGSAPEFLSCAEMLLQDRARSLVLDLSDVAYLDSSGLKVILEARDLAHGQGGTVTVRYASDVVRRLMEVTGLGALLVPGHDDADSTDG